MTDLATSAQVTLVEGGADVAVYAGHAVLVELACSTPATRPAPASTRIPCWSGHRGWWFAFVPGITAGRALQLPRPTARGADQGLRHNPAKLLLDPYAKAIEGKVRWGAESTATSSTFAGTATASFISGLDSRGHMPRGVVVDDHLNWRASAPNRSHQQASSTRPTSATRPRCTPVYPPSCGARTPGWPTPRRWPTSPPSG